MLSYVLGNSRTVRVLDYLLDFHREFTQVEVQKEAKISKPTAVKIFKKLLEDGLIKRTGRKYEVVWGEKTPMQALAQFDLRVCMYENERVAVKELQLNNPANAFKKGKNVEIALYFAKYGETRKDELISKFGKTAFKKMEAMQRCALVYENRNKYALTDFGIFQVNELLKLGEKNAKERKDP